MTAQASELLAKNRPLVVDMDQTLLRCDTLHEAVLAELSANPLRILSMFQWLAEGRQNFKHALANVRILPSGSVPFEPAVIAMILEAKEEGRRVALVSAADHRQVSEVAERSGLFDEWQGTTPDGPNLRGEAKSSFLVSLFGDRGFDYVGDSTHDLAVWKHAYRAITVGAGAKLRNAVADKAPEIQHLERAADSILYPYFRTLRPHQWVKNLLVFLPLLAAHEPGLFLPALVAFVVFSIAASAVYIINDLLDLAADRAHPRKSNRPFPACEIPILHGVIIAPVLLITAIVASVTLLPKLFVFTLLGYVVITFAYSLSLKRRLIVDIWALAALYTVRIIAGGAATAITPSPWLLSFSIFLFFSLAAVKRQGELVQSAAAGNPTPSGRAYRTSDLSVVMGMALASGHAAVVVFSLYINSPTVERLYPSYPLMWLVPPTLLYWSTYMIMAAHRGRMHDDPIIFAARDRNSRLGGVAILVVLLLAQTEIISTFQ